MKLSYVKRLSYFGLFVGLIVLLCTACGGGNSTTPSSATTPTTAATTALAPKSATATAAEASLIQQMTIIGTPTAKLVSGTTFEVDGQVKNGDDKQHDIYVKVALLDASGKVIASATQNVDNVVGGATENFAIQGTTPQATWTSVQATVVKVTENANGSGQD